MFVEVLHQYFKRRLEELSTIKAGDNEDNYNHKKTLENKLVRNIGMVVHNLRNLAFTSMTEDAYASAIFFLLKAVPLQFLHELCDYLGDSISYFSPPSSKSPIAPCPSSGMRSCRHESSRNEKDLNMFVRGSRSVQMYEEFFKRCVVGLLLNSMQSFEEVKRGAIAEAALAKTKNVSEREHDDEMYNQLVETTKEQGYDVTKLKNTTHINPPPVRPKMHLKKMKIESLKDNAYLIELNGSTSVRKASTNVQYVIGYITTVGQICIAKD
ncbi:hypothetical protein Tco_0168695 [Tanacetum coccineum]